MWHHVACACYLALWLHVSLFLQAFSTKCRTSTCLCHLFTDQSFTDDGNVLGLGYVASANPFSPGGICGTEGCWAPSLLLLPHLSATSFSFLCLNAALHDTLLVSKYCNVDHWNIIYAPLCGAQNGMSGDCTFSYFRRTNCSLMGSEFLLVSEMKADIAAGEGLPCVSTSGDFNQVVTHCSCSVAIALCC